MYPAGSFDLACELIHTYTYNGSEDVNYICEQWVKYLQKHVRLRRDDKYLLSMDKWLKKERWKEKVKNML